MDLIKPNVKRRKHFDVSLCVICNENLGSPNDSNFVNNPTSEGLSSLIEACKIRADDVASFILSVQDDILSKKIKISYHKTCRATYTSKSNLRYKGNLKQNVLSAKIFSTGTQNERPTCFKLSTCCQTPTFDIGSECFICRKSDRKLGKLSNVSIGTGDASRNKVLIAAEARDDGLTHDCMVKHPD